MQNDGCLWPDRPDEVRLTEVQPESSSRHKRQTAMRMEALEPSTPVIPVVMLIRFAFVAVRRTALVARQRRVHHVEEFQQRLVLVLNRKRIVVYAPIDP